jgi:hypothetical protein
LLADARTALRKVNTHRDSKRVAAEVWTIVDRAEALIQDAQTELAKSRSANQQAAADAIESAYALFMPLAQAARGYGLRTDLQAVLGVLEAAGDTLERNLHLPDL